MKRTLRWLLVLAVTAFLAVVFWPEAPPGPTGAWLHAAGLEARFDTVEGLRVRYVRAGVGPAVVLLHGFGSSIYTWKDVLPGLAESRAVLALDLPGFGESDRPRDLSFDSYPRVVLGLMDHLGIAQATLVGNSMGGAVATVIAGQTPGRVRGLVLIDAAGFNLEESDRPFLIRLAGSRIGGLADRLPVRGKLLRLALHQVFHDPALVTEERYNEYLAPLLRPGSTQAVLSLLHSRTLEPRLVAELAAKVKAPTLVLWGREDRWIPVAQADRFVAAIPGARKAVFDGCGHLPQEERPADVLRWLQEFPEGGSVE